MEPQTKFFHPETPETPPAWVRFPGPRADLRVEVDGDVSIGPDLNLKVERVTQRDIIARHAPRSAAEANTQFVVDAIYTINGERFRLRRITGELLIFRPVGQQERSYSKQQHGERGHGQPRQGAEKLRKSRRKTSQASKRRNRS
jgi:hypothetical protein